MHSSKFVEFVEYKTTPDRKTSQYHVMNKSSADHLGEITWYTGWRRFVFMPLNRALFDSECLNDIKTFIDELMEQRKNERETQG